MEREGEGLERGAWKEEGRNGKGRVSR